MKTSLKTLLLFGMVCLFVLACDTTPNNPPPSPKSDVQNQEPGPFDDNEPSAD